MIRAHFDLSFHSQIGYAVVVLDEGDKLLIINPMVVAGLPLWVREQIANEVLAMAEDLPPTQLAQVIDLVAVRAELRGLNSNDGCQRPAPVMHTTHQ